MSLSDNIRKAYDYMKRNGIKDTLYASVERLSDDMAKYEYREISEAEAKKQREARFDVRTRFSIVVPAYETNEVFARAMIKSVLAQTYPTFELIIADASSTDKVEQVVRAFSDERITYIRNTDNKGISANTNVGIRVASGHYIGLLDHDDLLTPDALYEMARKIEDARREGIRYSFIYSDEDKCDTYGEHFYEPNRKPEFNLDLLLSNNYICHFTVMEAALMKKLELRSEFDGAQDHDLVLRAYRMSDKPVGHVAKVLYHWRCHEASTASNPSSKAYAYEAGKRAVADFLRSWHVNGAVVDTKHKGFFRVIYGAINGTGGEVNAASSGLVGVEDIFKSRFDIGIVGGPIVRRGKITGGIIDETRTCPLEGVNVNFSGYMHRNILQKDAVAVDIRLMFVRKELLETLLPITKKREYREMFIRDLTSDDKACIDMREYISLQGVDDLIIQNLSYEICEQCRLEGYRVFYEPSLEELI